MHFSTNTEDDEPYTKLLAFGAGPYCCSGVQRGRSRTLLTADDLFPAGIPLSINDSIPWSKPPRCSSLLRAPSLLVNVQCLGDGAGELRNYRRTGRAGGIVNSSRHRDETERCEQIAFVPSYRQGQVILARSKLQLRQAVSQGIHFYWRKGELVPAACKHFSEVTEGWL